MYSCPELAGSSWLLCCLLYDRCYDHLYELYKIFFWHLKRFENITLIFWINYLPPVLTDIRFWYTWILCDVWSWRVWLCWESDNLAFCMVVFCFTESRAGYVNMRICNIGRWTLDRGVSATDSWTLDRVMPDVWHWLLDPWPRLPHLWLCLT